MSFGALAMGTQGFGLGMSTVGSFFAAKGQQTSLRYQADILENNAQMELLRGEKEQQRIKLAGGKVKAMQKTGFAANGVDLSSDSVANTLSSTDLMTEVDANTAAANAVRAAWGYRTQSMIKRSESESISPFMSAAGTLLTGASSVASSWYKLDKVGAFDKPPFGSTDDPIFDLGKARGWW